jgi:hypothetical protein
LDVIRATRSITVVVLILRYLFGYGSRKRNTTRGALRSEQQRRGNFSPWSSSVIDDVARIYTHSAFAS